MFLRNANMAAVSLAASGLLGCVKKPVGVAIQTGMLPVNLPETICHLPRVRVSAEREIRTVVGLRPYRPSGFRVAKEMVGETAVVHNYGHGGGGITLSWGTSKLAADMGLPGHVGPVAVLGCGAVGLATARLAQEAGFDVTIYTKAMPPETTSNIAGGQWNPVTVYDTDRTLTPEFTQQFVDATRYAYRRYQIMTDPKYGIRWMRNYSLSDTPRQSQLTGGSGSGLMEGMQPESKDLPPGTHPFGNKFVRQFDGMIVEPPIYLPAMLTDVRIAGGKVVVREMKSLDEVRGLPEKLVFNCTGLGAKALFGDDELTPIRGQLTFLLPQPEVTYATLYENTYMFSRRDGVLLGGTHEMGDWNLQPDLTTKAAILAKQAELFDGMRDC
ncbi:MAG TPA: FAD-dependent oxidoreductase [Edaphobacter sp.]|jgi:glycine/D-amino acid oxidase-like deaminating enzyme|nr:FAD-dependent oxidoreductase [Edaphobacter sp.]